MVKYRDTNKNWKVISKDDFHRLVKKWRQITEQNRLIQEIKANSEIEENEED